MLDALLDKQECIVDLDPLDEDLVRLLPVEMRVRHTNPARAKNLEYVFYFFLILIHVQM